jgi:hypothetical protein
MKTCRPLGGIVPAAENLGEHLTGETIENSAYDVGAAPDFSLAGRRCRPSLPPPRSRAPLRLPTRPPLPQIFMRVNETCKKLCTVEMNTEDIDLFVKRIDEDYNANWMVDNLPAATVGLLVGGAPLYARGIPLGGIEEGGRYFIYTHPKLVVR